MGFHFSGVAISKTYSKSSLDDLCFRLGLNKLEFREIVPFEKCLNINFDDTYIDIYFAQNATLVFCSSPDIGHSCDIEKASFKQKTCFFCVEETAMTMITSIFENCDNICQYTEINHEIKQSYLDNFPTNFKDGTDLAIHAIEFVTGLRFGDLDSLKFQRFNISREKVVPNFECQKFEKEYLEFLNPKENEPSVKRRIINNKPNNDKLSIFEKLVSLDTEVVKKELEMLNNEGFDSIILNYIMIVSLFHYNKEIRRLAQKIFRTFASDSIKENIETKWEANFLKSQSISRNKLLEHPDINVGECMCMFQVLRKNYFEYYPATEYNLYLDGRGGVIGDVFESYTKLITELPDTFMLLKHVTIVNLSNEPNLNLPQILTMLTHLPNLRTLRLEGLALEIFPEQIWKLKTLIRLSLKKNKFTSIPNHDKLPNLKSIEIVDCPIDLVDCIPFANLEIIEVDKKAFERMDIINAPRKLKVTSGRLFTSYVEPGNYYGEHKVRTKSETQNTIAIGNEKKPFWKFW